ncbi:hypothetical protein EDB85DRAFT_1992824 [Lactarius pseudohatsudake]|nr:hypothetical protein EDB85DRAFT_1992824 [Lactarius pseudohatsudake]
MAGQSLLSRELLKSMKRTDLQRVCKERGLKANLKTEEMIELLLDSSPPHSPRRPSRHRTVSTRAAGRQPSTRSRLHSTSSIIIHSDTDEDEMQHAVKPESEAPSTHHPGPITRTRKAQDAQLRLGVGRPTIVGGQGARTVTRSVGIAKGVRSRSGRGAKPTQDAIVEGTTEEALLPQSNTEPPQPRANENSTTRSTPRRDVSSSQAGVTALVEEQVQPLQRTIASLQKQLQQQASVHTREVATLNDKMTTVMNELRELHRQAESLQLLRSSMEQLQAELSRLRQGRGSESVHESTNAPRSIPSDRTSLLTNARPHRQPDLTRHPRTSRSSPVFEYPPPPAGSPVKPPSRDVPVQASNLGKRQRSLDARDTEDVSETDEEDTSEEESRMSVLGRKRAKAEQSAENIPEVPLAGPSNSAGHGQTDDHTFADQPPSEVVPSRPPTTSSTTAAPRQPSRDRVVGDEIFTDQDFDFFDNPSNLHRNGSASASQTVENQHPFTFAFPGVARSPVTLTPAPTGPLVDPPSTLPVPSSLPYPERPHSPSPAPAPYRPVARPPPSESYRPFGFPPDGRNPLGSPALHESAIDPATFLHTPPRQSPDIPSPGLDSIDGRQRASSIGLGMTSVPPRVEDTPAAPVRRTMYGTELEGDTRFGDFGVEGVATSYWAGGKF